MKVMVTGALGNIGLFTVDALLAEGHDVVAVDLDSRKARKFAAALDPRVRVVWGDITRPESLGVALEGCDAVVHLAAIIPPQTARMPALAQRVNVEATLGLIAQMEASRTAKRLVFASSTGIFGDVQDRQPPLRVETPVSPTDDYGRHKVACESAIRASRLRWSILRLAAVGPVRLQAQDPDIIFRFSPEARFEFIHPADAGTAFARAVACEDAVGKILYLGGGERCRMQYHDFIRGLLSPIGIGPFSTEVFYKADVPRFYGDWVDTLESQRLLDYQRRGLAELSVDLARDFGGLVPVLRVVRPLTTWFLERSSPYR